MLITRCIYLFLLMASLVLPGCAGREAAPNHEGARVDDLGRSVSLSHPIRRAVTMAPSLTEIVFAAGGGDRLVGVTTADDYPPAVDTLPRFSAVPVDFEALVRLQPDVVFATDHVNNPRDAEALAATGIPSFFFSFHTLEDVLNAVLTAGQILETEEQAGRTVRLLRQRLDALHAHRQSTRAPPLVLILIGDQTLYAFGRQSYVHEMVGLAGGRSATAHLSGASAVLSGEFVLDAQPDMIILAMGETYETNRLTTIHPTWRHVPAVSNGHVYSINQDLILRPTPRLIDGIEQMAAWIGRYHADAIR